MTQPPSGEWVYFNTELTNSSGRVSYVIPESKRLGIGVYPVKMVVRYAETLLNVLKNACFTIFTIFFASSLAEGTTRLQTAISLWYHEGQSLLCSVLTDHLLPVCL